MSFFWFIFQWRKPKEKPKRKPVSTLDEIIHDYDWFRPKDLKKERKQNEAK